MKELRKGKDVIRLSSTSNDLSPSLLSINAINWIASFATIIPFVIIPLYARSVLERPFFRQTL